MGGNGKKHPFFVLNRLISQLFRRNWREQCYIFPFLFWREGLKGLNQTQIGALSLEFSADEQVFEVEGLIISQTGSSRHQHPTIPGLAAILWKIVSGPHPPGRVVPKILIVLVYKLLAMPQLGRALIAPLTLFISGVVLLFRCSSRAKKSWEKAA